MWISQATNHLRFGTLSIEELTWYVDGMWDKIIRLWSPRRSQFDYRHNSNFACWIIPQSKLIYSRPTLLRWDLFTSHMHCWCNSIFLQQSFSSSFLRVSLNKFPFFHEVLIAHLGLQTAITIMNSLGGDIASALARLTVTFCIYAITSGCMLGTLRKSQTRNRTLLWFCVCCRLKYPLT